MIQATLFQIDNYGPWTTTPAPRREMDLQVLQSQLYAEVARFVGERDGYAFYARGDNVIAFTNDIDRTAHERFLTGVGNRYPVTLSAGIGNGETPLAAVETATANLQQAGSAQDPDRTGVCRSDWLDEPDRFDVAHFDVVNATERYTDERDAFGAFLSISRAYHALADRLYRERDGLAFFVGGDNVVAMCPPSEHTQYEEDVGAVADAVDVRLRVGVGAGQTAAAAGMGAKEALELARERESMVVRVDGGRKGIPHGAAADGSASY